MIYRFPTFEQAALFSLEKQNEGYFAEILHLNSGLIYGSIASSGFPVLVSKYAVQENGETPETIISHSSPLHLIAKILFIVSTIILSIPLFMLGLSLNIITVINPIKTMVVLVDLLWRSCVFILLFSFYVQTVIFIFQAFKDTSNAWNRSAKIIFLIVSIFVIPMILLEY